MPPSAAWAGSPSPDPLRFGFSEHGLTRHRAEVAAVERGRVAGGEQEHLALAELAATWPGCQRPSVAVVAARPRHRAAVDMYRPIAHAHALLFDRTHLLQDRHRSRVVSPLLVYPCPRGCRSCDRKNALSSLAPLP